MAEAETAERYDPQAIERKWQLVWEAENTWVVANPGSPEFDASTPKSYVLEMLPYPSGEPHVGHLKTYSVGDAIAHFRRRRGFRGEDASGRQLRTRINVRWMLLFKCVNPEWLVRDFLSPRRC